MSRIIGIDLGTTNSLAAAVDTGIPYVIADAEGQRLTPSIVHFPGPGADPVTGRKAAHVRWLKPTETVYSIKRFMGLRGTDLNREELHVTYPVQDEGAQSIRIPMHGTSYSPEEISAEILKTLKRTATEHFQEDLDRAVITVPAYFNDAQRNATKKAGELAGFTVERILNEPTAAALAYGLHRLNDTSRIAVYDLGGGTFDLSILELNEGVFQVLSTSGNTRLGGDDIDKLLLDYFIEQILEQGGPNPREDLRQLARLREAAERAKRNLTTEESVLIQEPFLAGTFHFEYRLTRIELESIAEQVVERTRPHCLRALTDAKLQPQDLDQVILVGGQTRMPLVRKIVRQIFQCSEFEEARGDIRLGEDYHRPSGPLLNTSQNPDQAVALGAAIQAEILSGRMKDLLLLDVTPLSLGIETFGGLMNVIIPRNTTIPVKAGEVFTTAVDFQRNMLIHVLQGERDRAADNWSIGKFSIEFEPAPRGVPRVGVQFEIDANGILHVLARDINTGKEQTVEITSAVNVDDEAVQKMVEDSVEHAFEDLNLRRWVEARMKARDTASATKKAVSELREVLSEELLDSVNHAIAKLEDALATENPQTGMGDLQALRTAHENLDQVTQPLADQMMDHLMDKMLEQRGILGSDNSGRSQAT